ncbi:MAG: hypothetical protein ABL989_06015 [Gammaproteobacteria bacterium]
MTAPIRLLLAVLMLATTGARADATAPPLDAGLAGLQASLDAGKSADVLPAGKKLLRGLPDDGTISADQRAAIYGLMFEGARRSRDLRGGNAFAADLQKQDRKRYGTDAVERVPGLYEAARWYAWADLTGRERDALTAAIPLLERAYGPRDPRLAWPLRTLASSCVRSRSDVDVARAALDRALKLDYRDTRDDVIERAAVFATRGDVEALFVEPAAGATWYRTAWQRLADSKRAGPDVANATFADPKPIYVNVPDEPFTSRRGEIDHFAAGTVSFGFTVTALGTIDELRLRQSLAPMESVPDPVTRAFREARYRPRLVAGEPVATPDHGFELRFSRDVSRAARKVRVGQVEPAR